MSDIHTDLEKIKIVAMYHAKQHGINYNIIILNPNDKGEFDFASGSTYEYVTDSYLKKERNNIKLLITTDQLCQQQSNQTN